MSIFNQFVRLFVALVLLLLCGHQRFVQCNQYAVERLRALIREPGWCDITDVRVSLIIAPNETPLTYPSTDLCRVNVIEGNFMLIHVLAMKVLGCKHMDVLSKLIHVIILYLTRCGQFENQAKTSQSKNYHRYIVFYAFTLGLINDSLDMLRKMQCALEGLALLNPGNELFVNSFIAFIKKFETLSRGKYDMLQKIASEQFVIGEVITDQCELLCLMVNIFNELSDIVLGNWCLLSDDNDDQPIIPTDSQKLREQEDLMHNFRVDVIQKYYYNLGFTCTPTTDETMLPYL